MSINPNRKPIIIGISGTNGAGKDSVAELLEKEYNFLFISMTDMLREEAVKRGLPVEREVLRTISAEWRRESGLGVLIDKSVQYYQEKGGNEKYSGLVLASLRNPGEADSVHALGGQVVWVDAEPKVRYERIFSRQRTDEDNKTFEQFQEEEHAEMQHSGDNATLSMEGVKKLSDRTLINNEASMESLKQAVIEVLGDLL